MDKTVIFPVFILFFIFISVSVITSCNQTEDSTTNSVTEEEQTVIHLPAMYSGTFPCADCPGIDYTLILEENKFTEIRHYRDRSPGRFETTGAWKVTKDTLVLMQSVPFSGKFIFSKDSLKLLDNKSRQTTGNLAEHYVLERTGNQPSIREHNNRLAEQGVLFFGGGNEPFWSARIDSSMHLVFETPQSALCFGKADSTVRGNKILFRAVTDTSKITIQSEQDYCQDSMSGYLFPRRVIIYLQTSESDMFSGCGLFLNG